MAKHLIPHTIQYPETAPFGAVRLVRPDYYVDGPTTHAQIFHGIEAAQLVRDAWLQSAWLADTLGNEKVEQLANQKDRMADLERQVRRSLIHAAHRKHHAGWFALRAGTDEHTPGAVMGVALAKHDVSGNLAERTYKQLFRPDKVYACVSDVDVDPDEQGSGVGMALFDASLASFAPDKVPTTFVLGRNTRLILKLGELGFEQTGVQLRTDLLGADMPLPETRMQGDSIQAVRERLAQAFPWLADAEVEY